MIAFQTTAITSKSSTLCSVWFPYLGPAVNIISMKKVARKSLPETETYWLTFHFTFLWFQLELSLWGKKCYPAYALSYNIVYLTFQILGFLFEGVFLDHSNFIDFYELHFGLFPFENRYQQDCLDQRGVYCRSCLLCLQRYNSGKVSNHQLN